jgi:hypothetical protein
MEMTANFWNPSASGGDWRSVGARTPGRDLHPGARRAQPRSLVGISSRGRQAATGGRPTATPGRYRRLVNAHLFGDAVKQKNGDAANAPSAADGAGRPAGRPIPEAQLAIIGESPRR